MEEWVDVLDDAGRKSGKHILKSEAHKKGIFHSTVHVWFVTRLGEVLLQQRAETKKTFPLFWDVSVAGHVAAGEEILQAALREIREEIGLTIREEDLIPVGVFKSVQQHENGIADCEFHHTFICVFHQAISDLSLQEEEVKDIRLIPMESWKEDLFSTSPSMKYVPHQPNYYQMVIRKIKDQLTALG
jgi:isopentenyldiphosphate isomerase